WLIESVLPRFDEGAAGYLFGPAKGRKSMFLADCALSVTTGTPALGRFEVRHTGTAVGFFAEEPKGETSRRIHRIARARAAGLRRLHLECRWLAGHVTGIFRIDNRGGPPGLPFKYRVEDGEIESGPTLRLVVEDEDAEGGEGEAELRDREVEEAIERCRQEE